MERRGPALAMGEWHLPTSVMLGEEEPMMERVRLFPQ
jgi:hypothetical protein